MGPINYGAAFGSQDPTQAFMQGLQGAMGMRAMLTQQQAQEQAVAAAQAKAQQQAQMQADIWAKLGGALDALVALPLPADVADIVNKSPNRRRSVDGKLARSLQWLKDFADACRRD